ncbi:MAG: hypothetical protein VB080_03360 [Propionicimonas sp.]|uniref:hypothetical protein n=1 Tax=Propionicimonas sp. TaxID=1955623 RepID=UPI002B21C640|nr:hypothetical protein [Propionicimonas sp.]MEA4943456.1 hypothetical protein [Propionicimonas sp.]
MGGRFWYVFLSVALVAAGLAAGVATWLEWLPCQGSMLNGSVLVGGQYLNDFSDACLARMDGSDALPLAPASCGPGDCQRCCSRWAGWGSRPGSG